MSDNRASIHSCTVRTLTLCRLPHAGEDGVPEHPDVPGTPAGSREGGGVQAAFCRTRALPVHRRPHPVHRLYGSGLSEGRHDDEGVCSSCPTASSGTFYNSSHVLGPFFETGHHIQ